jgi:DNA-binding transcriptional LysR family regulator
MRPFTQAVLRDTARRTEGESHFLVPGANECTVADQSMKKEIILAGMAWGHLPHFLIADELRKGRLLSIAGRHFPGVVEQLVVARRVDRPQGPISNRLWEHLGRGAKGVRTLLAEA